MADTGVPRLLIRKAMIAGNGKPRPVIQVQAILEPALQARLNELFGTEVLFKRAVYAQGFPAGTPVPNAAIAPALGSFLKNDACPEITVKTLLAGQTLQTNSLWDILAFEYIAQRAFDNLCELALGVMQIGTERIYRGTGAADQLAFAADALADVAAAVLPSIDAAATAA